MFVYKRGRYPSFHSNYYTSSIAVMANFVTKSDGRKERVQFDKITARVSRLCYGLDPEYVDAAAITQKVISGVYQGVTTIELDNLVNFGLSTLFDQERHY